MSAIVERCRRSSYTFLAKDLACLVRPSATTSSIPLLTLRPSAKHLPAWPRWFCRPSDFRNKWVSCSDLHLREPKGPPHVSLMPAVRADRAQDALWKAALGTCQHLHEAW
jgi:hypothetical protein